MANKSVPSNPNDVPLSTFIENNNESMDVNFVGRNNFGNSACRGNFNARPFPSNSSNIYGNSYTTLMEILIRCPLILRIVLSNL